MRGIKTETCEENPDDPDRKKFVSRLSPRLRHDCVISNDVGSWARKGVWYSHEEFHSKKWRCALENRRKVKI